MKRFLKRINIRNFPNIVFDKRQRFAIQTIILTLGLIIAQFIWDDYRFFLVGILAVLTYLLTAWSLGEDIKGNEWFLLFVLPVFLTVSISLFYFLLPGRMIVRLLITVVFAVGMYAVLLIENIYNVAGERSIQLLRAAQSVGLLITLAVVFLLSNIIFSIRVNFFMNFLFLVPLIFFLSLQSLWSARLEQKMNRQLVIYSLVVAGGIGQLGIALSFWPVNLSTAALLISAAYYASVGTVQLFLQEKLFRNTIREYIYAFILTLIVTFLATRWG